MEASIEKAKEKGRPEVKIANMHQTIAGRTRFYKKIDVISEHLQMDGMDFFVAGAGSMTDNLAEGSYTSNAKLIWSGTSYIAFAAM